MTMTLLAGPAGEPISRAEAKAYCRVDGDDEDALIDALIAAARLQVESLTGRALLSQTWRYERAGTQLCVELPILPVASLVVAPDGATIQGDAVLLAAPEDGVSIDYVAGYGGAEDVPADLKQAVLVLVAYWYENRDLATAPPLGFERLLAAYRRVRL